MIIWTALAYLQETASDSLSSNLQAFTTGNLNSAQVQGQFSYSNTVFYFVLFFFFILVMAWIVKESARESERQVF